MNNTEKKEYLEQYSKDKEKGILFFPDAIFKDAIVALIVFIALVGLAYFIGAPLESRANPADTNYTPRPEWYFLFIFQLLKYFPGNLEVIGVVGIPTLAIILLFLLPLIDRSPKRHYRQRPIITSAVLLSIGGILFLSIQSVREAPPPAEVEGGDKTAALYAANCAGCHGSTVKITSGINLHEIIAQGKHDQMPAWSGDLSSDQIDALAGFILSPGGSDLFSQNCGDCHKVEELVSSNPLELRMALEKGKEYPAHSQSDIPNWNSTLSAEERTTLLNFLVAPDGQRLFTIYCSSCHGQSVAFSGDKNQLKEIIMQGGKHLDMPPWREKLSEADIQLLANYVVNPSQTQGGQALFETNCTSCHGERIPQVKDTEQAIETISSGGAHQAMPIWGNLLTNAQLDALVDYTLQTSEGSSIEQGQVLFGQYCTSCHGEFGEGGLNPSRPDDTIFPISTAEYLKTRDDFTLRAIIAQGQPNLGMSPFGSTFGGPLSDEEISLIVSYLRSWQENPPVELPPEIKADTLPVNGADIYQEVCAQCHGINGEGGVGPSLSDRMFQANSTDQALFDSISKGHPATAMIGWGEILSEAQINELVNFIRQIKESGDSSTPQSTETPASPETSQPPTFAKDVMPILKEKCIICHGSLGGWDASRYDTLMNSGDNAPVVIPGDPDNSLLALKILGEQTEGTVMPPPGRMSDDDIQVILDWIKNGALNN